MLSPYAGSVTGGAGKSPVDDLITNGWAVIYVPLAPIVLIVFACWLLKRLAQGEGAAVAMVPGDAAPAAA